MRPPIWLIGEYYVVSQESGDQYLYVIPTVYNKISEDNPYNAQNRQVVQIYAQVKGVERGSTGKPKTAEVDEDGNEIPSLDWYESWSCNMIYRTDLEEQDKEDTVITYFYEGTSLLQA